MLKEFETDRRVEELTPEHGISRAASYKGRQSAQAAEGA
jgi:hypothetical protein